MDFTESGLPQGTYNGTFSSSGNSFFCQAPDEFSLETTVSNGHFRRPRSVLSAIKAIKLEIKSVLGSFDTGES